MFQKQIFKHWHLIYKKDFLCITNAKFLCTEDCLNQFLLVSTTTPATNKEFHVITNTFKGQINSL